MFGYCLNNPANGYDPCGTCFHNWKLYNCEKCDEFWNSVGEKCVEAYNTINSVYLQQTQLQAQITMQQNEMIANAADALWNAHVHSIELDVQRQYEHDMRVRASLDYAVEHPKEAISFSITLVGAVSVYLGGLSTFKLIEISPIVGNLMWSFDAGSFIWGVTYSEGSFWKGLFGSEVHF